ncbi:MAG: MoaD/ThiS family protein [Dehalococcoidales bacterium]|nr:MAG: MoaD/ThiS family protein [Dehalococcoidales bacterium]
MSVKINIPSYFQYFTSNNNVVEVTEDTVIGCLKELAEKYPDIQKLIFDSKGTLLNQSLNHVTVFINGVAVHPDELASRVNDGDEMDLTYVILGG